MAIRVSSVTDRLLQGTRDACSFRNRMSAPRPRHPLLREATTAFRRVKNIRIGSRGTARHRSGAPGRRTRLPLVVYGRHRRHGVVTWRLLLSARRPWRSLSRAGDASLRPVPAVPSVTPRRCGAARGSGGSRGGLDQCEPDPTVGPRAATQPRARRTSSLQQLGRASGCRPTPHLPARTPSGSPAACTQESPCDLHSFWRSAASEP